MQASGAFFDIAGGAEGFHVSCREACPSRDLLSVLSGFHRFSLGGLRE